jgi:hypothetical protein
LSFDSVTFNTYGVGRHTVIVNTTSTSLVVYISGSTLGWYDLDNISVTLKDDVYQAITDTAIGDSLTDTTKFQVLPRVSRQDLVVHRINKTTLAYDKHSFKGTHLFEDTASVVDIMNYYYGSPDELGLWSDETYYYLPLDIFGRLS